MNQKKVIISETAKALSAESNVNPTEISGVIGIYSNIINFLELFAEAEHNSKIFITSRIPINHGDIPIKVGSFSDKEATDYFQRLFRISYKKA